MQKQDNLTVDSLESLQEQAARAAHEAEQNADAEDPFGKHWQKLMLCHSKHDLVETLKNALQRADKTYKEARVIDDERVRLHGLLEDMQAEINRCYEATDSRKAIS